MRKSYWFLLLNRDRNGTKATFGFFQAMWIQLLAKKPKKNANELQQVSSIFGVFMWRKCKNTTKKCHGRDAVSFFFAASRMLLGGMKKTFSLSVVTNESVFITWCFWMPKNTKWKCTKTTKIDFCVFVKTLWIGQRNYIVIRECCISVTNPSYWD